jgi:hypothetical protein
MSALLEIELFPLLKLRSYFLAEISYMIFHPRKAWGEWRGRIAYKLSRKPKQGTAGTAEKAKGK